MNRASEQLRGAPVPDAQQLERDFKGQTMNTDLGYSITLAPQKKFEAGEGVLFETDKPDLIAKFPFEMTREHELRLEAFEQHNGNVPQNMDSNPLLVLPISPIRDAQGKIRGELMQYIKSPYKLDNFMRVLDRMDRQDPKYELQFLTVRELLLYGLQLAQALDTYHTAEFGGVVGDLNKGGVLATRPYLVRGSDGNLRIHPGGISLIDLGTSQIRDKNGIIIPSSGVAKDYFAPEVFFSARTYEIGGSDRYVTAHPHYKKLYTTMLEKHDPNKKPREPKEDLYILAEMMHELLFAEPLTTKDPTRKPKYVPIGRTGKYAISNTGLSTLDTTTLPIDTYGPKLMNAFYKSLVLGYDDPYARVDCQVWIEAIKETLALLRACPNGVRNHLVVEGSDPLRRCNCCYTESQDDEAGRYFAKIRR